MKRFRKYLTPIMLVGVVIAAIYDDNTNWSTVCALLAMHFAKTSK